MIPAPPRISAPPRRESRADPRPAPTSPRPRLPRPPRSLPRGPSPATRLKANDADISHASATPQEIPPNGSTPVPARPHPTRRQFPRPAAASGSRAPCPPRSAARLSTRAFPPTPFHLHLSARAR